MRCYLLRCEVKTTAALDDCFRFFENPYNLAEITPPWLSFSILDKGLKMRQGLAINYRIKLLGIFHYRQQKLAEKLGGSVIEVQAPAIESLPPLSKSDLADIDAFCSR
ncbi:MAG: hypothetical protein IT168_14720 [Bryobacterales bacterium]|nr:hypothetical protein [Bryobacterales bacterium]